MLNGTKELKGEWHTIHVGSCTIIVKLIRNQNKLQQETIHPTKMVKTTQTEQHNYAKTIKQTKTTNQHKWCLQCCQDNQPDDPTIDLYHN